MNFLARGTLPLIGLVGLVALVGGGLLWWRIGEPEALAPNAE
jgi:hypothetical protein